MIKHGLSRTPEYKAWSHMVHRCTRTDHPHYKHYGGRGITVYEEWLKDPASFIEHIGPRPSPRHSLDRKNNSKGYEPGNVRWATSEEQIKNRRPQAGTPGAKLQSNGYWRAFTPVHPVTKRFKWIRGRYYSQEEAYIARNNWLQENWPTYPEGRPLTVWP